MSERVVRVGIATLEQQKARLMAIAKGEHKPTPNDPKIWFSSIESLSQTLSTKNQMLLEIIAASRPASIAELEALSGRSASNLSRTLKNLARLGFVRMERAGKAFRPLPLYDRVQIDIPLLAAASERREAHCH